MNNIVVLLAILFILAVVFVAGFCYSLIKSLKKEDFDWDCDHDEDVIC